MSPKSIFTRILLIIFVAEFVVMMILEALDVPVGLPGFLLDSVLLSVTSAPLLFLWVVRPMTAALRAQGELAQRLLEQESETRFRTTLASIGDGLITTDLEGRVDYMNPVAQQLTGWEADDARGRPVSTVFRIVNAQTRAETEDPTRRALREGIVIGLANHTLLIARDGTERQISDSCAPIRDAAGRVRGAVLVFRDVTEDYRQRQQLAESEERHRMLFQSSRDAILTMAPPTWRFTSANAAALEMLAATSMADLAPLSLADVSPATQPGGQPSTEKAQAAIDEALRKGSNFFPWTHKKITGNTFSASVLLARTEMNGNTILQVTIRDITEQQRLETELGHARKLEAVGQLAAGIAHEINTPAQFVGDSIHFLADSFKETLALIAQYRSAMEALTGASGYEAVARQVKEAEAAADIAYVEENAPAALLRALDGVSRISAIVGAMKEFAHPDRREKSPADLNRALRATLTIAKNEYKYVADVELELGPLPPVVCHLGDLNQVFLNLLVNAAHSISDAVAKSGNRGHIRVRTAHEGNWVRIDIGDTGCGIPPEIRNRVFDPFFTTKEVGRGSGQGLAIARSVVVDKHGGSLTFESEVGKGTTFTILLPVDGSSVARPAAAVRESAT